ncbi:DUF3782 domain-containing protein [Thermoflexus hugenholtzii]
MATENLKEAVRQALPQWLREDPAIRQVLREALIEVLRPWEEVLSELRSFRQEAEKQREADRQVLTGLTQAVQQLIETSRANSDAIQMLVARSEEHSRRLEEHSEVIRRLVERVEEHSQRLEEHSEVIRRLVERVEEHSRRLEEHSEVIRRLVERVEEHSRRLEEHSEVIRRLVERVEEHSRRLEEHSQRLEEHSRRLEEHSEVIRRLVERVEEHSRRLEEHSEVIRQLIEKVERHAQVIERLLAAVDRHSQEIRRLGATIGAIGARWGLHSEAAFRDGMAALLQEAGWQVDRFLAMDPEGYVFGRPDQVEIDVVIRDGKAILIEIRSSVSRGDVAAFQRKAEFYARRTGLPVARRILISPMVDPRARDLAQQMGMEVYTYPEDVPPESPAGG